MPHPPRVTSIIIACLLWTFALNASAQPIGTFRWQILPYCNVVTLNIAQQSAVYTLDGTDDRCGAAQAASARGMAFLNSNGTIGFGVTMVQPGGVPVHLEATISLPTLDGTWRDSSGASGNFVLTPGAGSGGPPRGVSASGVSPGSITAIQLAPGAVTAAAIAANSITNNHIVDGTVNASELANGAVGPAAIAANAVSGVKIADGSVTIADFLDAPRVAASSDVGVSINVPQTMTVIRSVTITTPSAGHVIVNASGSFFVSGTSAAASCFILRDGDPSQQAPPSAGRVVTSIAIWVPFGGTRAFTLPAGSWKFNLSCLSSPPGLVIDPIMTAIFIAGS